MPFTFRRLFKRRTVAPKPATAADEAKPTTMTSTIPTSTAAAAALVYAPEDHQHHPYRTESEVNDMFSYRNTFPSEYSSSSSSSSSDIAAAKYELGKLLSEGAFGSVFACTDKLTNERLVIKRTAAADLDASESEAACLKLFQHPNIVRFADAFHLQPHNCDDIDDEDVNDEEAERDYMNNYYLYSEGAIDHMPHPRGTNVWIVLERMDGGDLADLTDAFASRWPQRIVGYVAQQALQALEFLHHNDVVHRDIKPPNILWNTRGEIKLADFGLATVLTQEHPTCAGKFGTRGYRAPELLAKREYGTKADIFSLGMALMELIQGRQQTWEEHKNHHHRQVAVALTCFGGGGSSAAVSTNAVDSCSGPLMLDARLFLRSMLEFDPLARCTARQLLHHDFLAKYKATAEDFYAFAVGIKGIQSNM